MDTHSNSSQETLPHKSLEDELRLITRFMSIRNRVCVGYAEIIILTDDIRLPRNTRTEKPGIWLDLEDLDSARAKLQIFAGFLREVRINSCELVVDRDHEAAAKDLLKEFQLGCSNTIIEFTSPIVTRELTKMVDPEHNNSKFVISKLAHVFQKVGKLDDPDKVFGRHEGSDIKRGSRSRNWIEAGPVIANSRDYGLKDRLVITVYSQNGFVDDLSPTDEDSMVDLQHRKEGFESSCLNIIPKHDEIFVKRATSLVRAVEAALSLQSRNEWIKLKNISTKGLCVERLIKEQTCLCHSLDDLEFRSRVTKRMQGRIETKNVYVIGETGQGKSCTLRGLCGSVVQVIQNVPTSTIDSYVSPSNIVFHDAPGLNDEQGRDRRIVASLVAHVADRMSASSILYVRKDWSRLPKSEQNAIRKYWDVFGAKLADMIIIVVTSKRSEKVERDVRTQLLKMKSYLGPVPSTRIVYLGSDVDKAVLDRKDFPESELVALENLLKNDEPRSTVNSDVLHEILEDGAQFWSNGIMVQRQRAMLKDSLPWVPGTVKGTLNHSHDKWIGRRSSLGPVAILNAAFEFLNISTQLGAYNSTVLEVDIAMAGQTSARAVRNSTKMADVIDKVYGHGGLLVHVVITGNVQTRIRNVRRSYIAVCPGEKLAKELKDETLVALYNEKAYAELVRAAQAECSTHTSDAHHV